MPFVSEQIRPYYIKAREIFTALPENMIAGPDLTGGEEATFNGLDANGYPIFMAAWVTESKAYHETGHAYEAIIARSIGLDEFRTRYWKFRGFPGTWKEAYDEANAKVGMAQWVILPGESVAEAFKNAVYGYFFQEKTLDYGKTLDPLATRAFFKSFEGELGMSQYGISEAMRWDADFRATFTTEAAATVTDDMSSFSTIAGFPATAQYIYTTPLSPRYQITPEMIPGQALWWHERGHHLHAQLMEKVGTHNEERWLRELFTARGADPALVSNRALAKEQAASMLPEAFGLGWGGYTHPCPNVPVPPTFRAFYFNMLNWSDEVKFISGDIAIRTDAQGNADTTRDINGATLNPPTSFSASYPVMGFAQRIGVAGSESSLPNATYIVTFTSGVPFGRLVVRNDPVKNGTAYFRLMAIQ